MTESETETGTEVVVSEDVVGEESPTTGNDELESRARAAKARAGEREARIASLAGALHEVATLKREKVFLFATPKRGPSAMSGAGRFVGELDGVASAARSSGDRGELLHYMRLRRSA